VDGIGLSIVREDTGAMLGKVGSIYKPFQNTEGFAFLDGVIGEFGAKYESAGALYGGSKVFMLVHLPKQAFAVGKQDQVEPYVIFSNSHTRNPWASLAPRAYRRSIS
jgi:hypothetical protein